MGATSVTGVGVGSAEGMDKGRKHYSIGVERLIGPRVVAAGTVDTAVTTVVVLPDLAGSASDYVAMGTRQTGTATSDFTMVLADVAGPPARMTLTVTAADAGVFSYAVIKVGLVDMSST